MFAVPSFFGYNTTFVSTPVATAATGVGETSFTANWNAFAGAQYYLLDVSTSSSFSSFVFQDRVIYTNSYAVTGLTASTTYYYRVRASTTYETDAAAFFTRVTSAGGTLTTTEQQAVNSLVIQMKADGIWTAMKAIYPMVGGGTGSTAAREAACAQNLVSASFTGTFTSGWTFASTGVTPNGTSAYFNTTFNPNGLITSTNCHLSFYQANATLTTPDKLHGAVAATSFYQDFWGNTVGTSAIGTTSSGSNLITSNNSMFILTAPSSTAKIFRATTQIATFTSTGAMPNLNLYFGAANENGTANYFTNAGISFASLGDGLTDTQASNFYTLVQAFQTTLGRAIAP